MVLNDGYVNLDAT